MKPKSKTIKTKTAPLTNSQKAVTEKVAQVYAVGISDHAYTAMQTTDPQIDPVAAQYIPQINELLVSGAERIDPTGDNAHSPVKGIVHRYPDRALLKITNICPVYCRYCFRKSMIGPQSNEYSLTKTEREAAIQYIRDTPQIWETILTGGDPLILSAAQIGETLDKLEAIKHIRTLRIHTRTPIASPEKITAEMAASLTRDKALYIIMHINHAQELTPEVITAIQTLQKTGAVLLSQSVLLKNINDSVKTLENLFRELVALKVKPYMLHQLDAAPGTEHFRVPIEQGQHIMRELRGNISGLCMPEYMLDIPNGHGKIPLTPSYCSHNGDENYTLTDPQGKAHSYPPHKAKSCHD